MHEYYLNRYDHGNDSTLSFLCNAEGKVLSHFIEDEEREVKVNSETRIPAGRYEIKLRTEGGFHPKYRDRFPEFHKGMLWLQDVPNFTWVYIHIGNDDDDTGGCLLTGSSPNPDYVNGGGTVSASVNAYRRIYPLMADAIEKGERVFITVRDLNGGADKRGLGRGR